MDSWGRPVASGSAEAGSVDVSALKPGAYTLRLLSADGKTHLVQRFMK